MDRSNETALLDRFLDPIGRCLTQDVARRIVALRTDEEMQARIDELAEKSNEGRLSESECQEYDTYVRAIDFVTVLQLKARSILPPEEIAS